jgi:GNAT superfamily N-acetyltransferase
VEVRSLEEADRPWVADLCRRLFGSEVVVRGGRSWEPAGLPGLVAWAAGGRAGALCLGQEPGGAEVVFLAVEHPSRGVGTVLLASLEALGTELGWRRLRVFTTNDNTRALGFYQRRGWDLVALHHEAVTRDRQLKPRIPTVGFHGIPIRHLLELERRLGAGEAT